MRHRQEGIAADAQGSQSSEWISKMVLSRSKAIKDKSYTEA